MTHRTPWIAPVTLAVALAVGSTGAQGPLPPPSRISGVALAADRVYVVDLRPFPGYLRALSVADPTRPTQLAAGELTFCNGPRLAGLSDGVAEVLCTDTSYAV